LKAAYLHGKDRGIPLDGCLKFAGALELAGDYKLYQAEAWSDLERLRVAVEEGKPKSPDDERRQRGLELWNSGTSWPDVAEVVYGDRENWKTIQTRIRRYAKDNKLRIREGKPGAKTKN
jgi:hypothetical protein